MVIVSPVQVAQVPIVPVIPARTVQVTPANLYQPRPDLFSQFARISAINNTSVINYTVKNNLGVDLSGIDNSKISPEGIDLDKALADNGIQLKEAVNRLYGDKNVDGEWLKWIGLPEKQLAKAGQIQNFVETNVRNKFSDVVVLGIGGSSLGPKALVNALVDSQWNQMSKEQRNGYPRIHFIENIDPDRYSEVIDKLNLKDTLVLVISKSGKTPETSATFLNMQERLNNAVAQGIIPQNEVSKHVVAITDKNPEKSILKQEAIKHGYQTFEVPDDVGGRYSVFSDVGLVPAAMVGINITELLRGASTMSKVCSDTKNLKQNPAASQALVHYLMYQKGKEYSVLMPYSDKLSLVSDWYAQLWAESLGKTLDKNGNTVHANYSPIKAIGAIDQHSQLQLWREGKNDKVFRIITVNDFNKKVPITTNPANVPDALKYMRNNTIGDLINIEANATKTVLLKDKRPVIGNNIPKVDEYNVGQLLQALMTETAIVGELHGLGRNTFLQPAVEEGKKITQTDMLELSKQKEQPVSQSK